MPDLNPSPEPSSSEPTPIPTHAARAESVVWEEGLARASKLFEAGDLAAAESELRTALRVCTDQHGADSPQTAGVQLQLAILLATRREISDAIPFAEAATAVFRTAGHRYLPRLIEALTQLGELRFARADTTALDACQEAFDLCRQSQPETSPISIRLHNNLAAIHLNAGRLDRAEPILHRVVELSKKVHGDSHPTVATLLNNLGELYRQRGEYQAAERCMKDALTMRRQTVGWSHPLVGQSLSNLGTVWLMRRQLDKAREALTHALRIRTQTRSANHPEIATTLVTLGRVHWESGRLDQAEGMLQQAIRIYERLQGDTHPRLPQTLGHLAGVCLARHRRGPAERHLERALEISQQGQNLSRTDAASLLCTSGDFHAAVGDVHKAEVCYRKALEIQESLKRVFNPEIVRTLYRLARILGETGRVNDAIDVARRAIEMCGSMPDTQSDQIQGYTQLATFGLQTTNFEAAKQWCSRAEAIAETNAEQAPWIEIERLRVTAVVHHRCQQLGDAETMLLRAINLFEANVDGDTVGFAPLLRTLAKVYTDQKNYRKAAYLVRRTLQIQEKATGKHSRDVACDFKQLADLSARQAEFFQAEELLRRAIEIQEQIMDECDPEFVQTLEALCETLEQQGQSQRAREVQQRIERIESRNSHVLDELM